MRRLVFAALLVSSPALAQDQPEVDPTTGQVTVWAPETLVDFETVEVGGSIVKPTIVWHQELTRKKFAPMIRVRKSFDGELLSSVDDVK